MEMEMEPPDSTFECTIGDSGRYPPEKGPRRVGGSAGRRVGGVLRAEIKRNRNRNGWGSNLRIMNKIIGISILLQFGLRSESPQPGSISGQLINRNY